MNNAREQRRLAAILAADVVGYSRHMGEDETATRSWLNHLQDSLIFPCIKTHGGRVVKLMGDGLLVEFLSVVDAVNCAVEWQRDIAKANHADQNQRQLIFRIGINLGDIIVEGDDIHGDGVNIAARIEALADPGGIALSRSARDQVRDKLKLSLKDMGEVEVKNIARPVRVFKVMNEASATATPATPGKPVRPGRMRMVAAGLVVLAMIGGATFWWQWQAKNQAGLAISEMKLPLPARPSVAVMPFSGPPGEDAAIVADSIAQDVTSYLGQVSGLFVISSRSAFTYKGKTTSPQQIASDLGVRNIVQGRVRGTHPTMSVAVEMIDGVTGTTIWQETFDESNDHIFALKEDITRAIARELAINVTRSSAPKRQTDSEEAYMLWYRANRAINQPPSREQYDFARVMAESAQALDPDFGRAKAALAYIHTQNGYFGFVEDRKSALQQGLTLAEQAVFLAPDDWYSHEMHGFALMHLRQYHDAALAFDRSIALAPANASTLVRSTLPLLFLGRADEAERRLLTAMRINPVYNWANANFLGIAFYEQERYPEAVERLDEAAVLNPGFIGNILWRAAAYAQIGDDEMARQLADALLQKAPKWTISNNFVQIKDPSVMKRLNDGLRKAGLPE